MPPPPISPWVSSPWELWNQSQHCIFTLNTQKLYHCLGKLSCVSLHFAIFSDLRICLPLAKAHRKKSQPSCITSHLPVTFPSFSLSQGTSALGKRWTGREILLCSASLVSLTQLTRLALLQWQGLAYAYTIICSERLDLRLDVNWNHLGVSKHSTLLSLGTTTLEVTVFLNIEAFFWSIKSWLIRIHGAYINKPLQQRLQMSPSATSRHSELTERVAKIKTGRYTTVCRKDALLHFSESWPKSEIALMSHPRGEASLFSLKETLRSSGINKTWFSL